MTFHITLSPGHQTFTAEPDETILHAAHRQGIALPYGCRNGMCGMCKGKLLAGNIVNEHAAAGLSDSESRDNYILCCQAMPRENLRVEIEPLPATKRIPARRMPARVESISRLNHDVLHLILKLPQSLRFTFLAGQYIDFILPDGRHRSFSLANPPQQSERVEFHIRHVDGGRFTGELFDHLKVGDVLRIEGPLGAFFLRDTSARPVIFMAGGTGFAPVKSIIEDTLARGIPRLLYLYWGARAREDLYLHELALDWSKRYSHIRYIPVLSDPKPEDRWQGRTGFVHEAVAADFYDMSGYEVYGSGPPAMVYAGRDIFSKQGLARENYYSDAFEFAND